MRAAIYARFSTDLQDETSIEDQIRVGHRRAHRDGWDIVAEYTDEGISGCALGNRPGVNAALRDGYARKFDVIIVTETLRFARGEDLPLIVRRLKFHGVRVIGIQDGFDSFAPHARMQAGMSAIMGGEYIDMIARRTHSALEMRAEAGKSAGGRPYGYTGKHEVVESEAIVVREIFARFAAGESPMSIASSFNARGLPSPGASWRRTVRRRDGRWLASGVRAIVTNEIYAGRFVWNRSQWVKDPDSGRRQRRMRPESEWIRHDMPDLAIVDAATWEAAQARLRTRAGHGGGKGGKPKYLLSGLLECGLCAAKMTVVGGSEQRYGCATAKNGGPHACSNSLTVPRELAEQLILAPVVDDLLSPAAVEHAVRAMRSAVRADIQAVPTAELGRIDSEAAELRTLVTAGRLSPQRCEVLLTALEAERQALLRARHNVTQPPTTDELAALYRETAQEMRARIRGDDVVTARETLRALVGPIRCQPEANHLVAHFSRGVTALLRVAGVDEMVAGAGFAPVYSPILLRRPPQR